MRDDRFDTVLMEHGKSWIGTVYSMSMDSVGGISAGLQYGGMLLHHVNRISTLTVGDGMPKDSARSVYQDRHGAVWIGTANGFAKV